MSGAAAAPPPRRHRGRRLFLVFAVLSVIGAVAAWLARDLPRRRAETLLERAFGGSADVRTLSVRGTRRFVLHDVVVREPAIAPWVREARVVRAEIVTAQGAAGGFESVVLDGVVARVARTRDAAAAPERERTHVGRLEVRHGRIDVEGAESVASVHFEGSLTDFPVSPAGEFALRGAELPIPALSQGLFDVRLDGTIDRVDGKLRFDRGAEGATLELALEGASPSFAGRRVDLGRVELDAVATLRAEGTRVDVQVAADGVESAEGSIDLDPSFGFRSLGAKLTGVDAGIWLGRVDPPLTGTRAVGRIDLTIDGTVGQPFRVEASGDLAEVETRLGNAGSVAVEDLVLRGGGKLNEAGLVEHRLELQGSTARFELGTSSGVLSTPRLSLEGGAATESAVRGAATIVSASALPERLARVLPARATFRGTAAAGVVPSAEGRVTVETRSAGKLDGTGRVELRSEAAAVNVDWTWRAARIEELVDTNAWGVRGELQARGKLEGVLTDPSISAAVEARNVGATAAFGTNRFVLRDGNMDFDVVRRPGAAGAAISSFRGTATLDPSDDLEALPLAFEGQGQVDSAPALQIETLRASLGELGSLDARGTWRPSDGAFDGALGADVPQLEPLRRYFDALLGDALSRGPLRGRATATLDPLRCSAGSCTAGGGLEIADVGLASDDGARVVEGLSGRWDLDAAAAPAFPISVDARGRLSGPVVLWDAVFGDFRALELDLAVEARVAQDGVRFAAEARAPQGMALDARLERVAVEDGAATLDAALDARIADLATFLAQWVRGPLEGSVPGLAELAASGAASFSVTARFLESSSRARGRLGLENAAFAGASGRNAATGLDVELPFDMTFERDEEGHLERVTGPPLRGALRHAGLTLGGIEFPASTFTLRVAADTLRLDEPTEIPLLGGVLRLERLTLADLVRPERHLGFALGFDGLELERLSSALGGLEVEGELSGRFPEVRISAEELRAEGGGAVALFGGTLALHDISARDVFTRYPRVTFAADFRDIDLLSLTRRFAFGEVSGVAQGSVRDCELVRGLPVRCTASFETVERPGVPRKIDVQAIENLTILGAGGAPDVFRSGVQRLFRTRTYAKIGVRLELRDDRFVLRGTARRGERELFVKGRLPLPIDVVNVAPGQAVSFQTMLRRVRNLRVSLDPPPDL